MLDFARQSTALNLGQVHSPISGSQTGLRFTLGWKERQLSPTHHLTDRSANYQKGFSALIQKLLSRRDTHATAPGRRPISPVLSVNLTGQAEGLSLNSMFWCAESRNYYSQRVKTARICVLMFTCSRLYGCEGDLYTYIGPAAR